MKILHIVEGFGGGVYSFLKDLCNNACEDFEIVVAYTRRPQTPENFESEFSPKIKLVNMEMSRNINLIKDMKDLFKIIKLIKLSKPDIIHLHSSKAGFLGRVACLLIGFDKNKVFYNPHGFAFLQENFSYKKRKLFFFLEKIAAKIGQNIIGVSNGEAKEALKLSTKVFRVDNAIDSKEIDKLIQESGKDKDKGIVLGTIGRISYQKNPGLFNLIAKQFPDFTFLWVGDGELRNQLDASNIEVTGWMERERAIDEMQKIDIYIQTSLWEGLPIALLEAMYLKKPIVANNVIGNNDVVIHEYNGFLCNGKDDFIKYIDTIAKDNALSKKMGDNSRKYVTDNHLLNNMVENYKNIYLGKLKYYN